MEQKAKYFGYKRDILKMKTKKRKNQKDTKKHVIRNLFPLYNACMDNAHGLLDEARLLYSNKYYQRSFFLALTAYEEIGKAQITADYINDLVSKEEFEKSFKAHDLKCAYNQRFIQIYKNGSSELIYNSNEIKEFTKKRVQSLYVGIKNNHQPSSPEDQIKPGDAKEMINLVEDTFNEIFNAYWLNQRIGTKGLFK